MSELKVLSLAFNQDCSCCVIGTSLGFRVVRLDPFSRVVDRDFQFEVPLVEMYFRTNIFAFVGAGFKLSPCKLVLWDDLQNAEAGGATFSDAVKSCRLSNSRMAVGLAAKTVLFSFPEMKAIDVKETSENQKGILALFQKQEVVRLAYLGQQRGELCVSNYLERKVTIIQAHLSSVALTEFAGGGRRVLSCSQKGTNVRAFDCLTGEMVQEVLRGNQFATIYSLATDPLGEWLGVSSDSCNIHLFSLRPCEDEEDLTRPERVNNPKSMFRCFRFLVPSLGLQQSFAWLKLPDFTSETRIVLGFGKPGTLLIATSAGRLHKAKFDLTHGGSMKIVETHDFKTG